MKALVGSILLVVMFSGCKSEPKPLSCQDLEEIKILDVCANMGIYIPEYRRSCLGIGELISTVFKKKELGLGYNLNMQEACYKACQNHVTYYMTTRKALLNEH